MKQYTGWGNDSLSDIEGKAFQVPARIAMIASCYYGIITLYWSLRRKHLDKWRRNDFRSLTLYCSCIHTQMNTQPMGHLSQSSKGGSMLPGDAQLTEIWLPVPTAFDTVIRAGLCFDGLLLEIRCRHSSCPTPLQLLDTGHPRGVPHLVKGCGFLVGSS